METEIIIWNRCFICSSIIDDTTNTQDKSLSENEIEEDITPPCNDNPISQKETLPQPETWENDKSLDQGNMSLDKTAGDVFLEYLLTHCKTNRIIGKLLVEDIKKFRPMTAKEDKERVHNQGIQVRFCSTCQQSAEQVKSLHLELQSIQTKIVEKLTRVKQSVVIGSIDYGSDNAQVIYNFKQFETWLKDQERQGHGENIEAGRKFIQVLRQFQTTVFESDTRMQDIPLTYVNGGLLQNLVGEESSYDYDETDSSDDEELFQPHRFLRTEVRVGDSSLNLPARRIIRTKNRRKIKVRIRQLRHDRTSRSRVTRRTLAARTKKLMIQMKKKRNITPQHVIVKHGGAPIPSGSNAMNLDNIPTYKPPKASEAMELAKRFRREWMKTRKEKKLKVVGQVMCEQCSFVTIGQPKMEQHLREHETHERNHQCPDCQRGFTTKQYYELHLMYHCGVDLWRCDACEKPIARAKVSAHLRDIHQDKIYSCEQCDCYFIKFPNLVLHSLAHVGELTINCEMCPKPLPFSSKRRLLRHLSEEHNQTQLLIKCDYENCTASYITKSDLWAHKQTHSLPSFGCPTCGRCFINNFRLQLHIKTLHKNERVYRCNKCSEKFRTIGDREKHLQSDHGVSNYKCDLCPNEVFVHATSLRLHKYRKHGEKVVPQFPCTVCDKIFVHKGKWRDHERTHSDLKEFTCEVCGFATRTDRLLKAHMTKHDGAKNYACTYCPKRFVHKKYLTCHLRVHTLERPFKCDICESTFNQQGALKVHKKKHEGSKPFTPRGPRKKKKKGKSRSVCNSDENFNPEPESFGTIIRIESTTGATVTESGSSLPNVEHQQQEQLQQNSTPTPDMPAGPSSSVTVYFDGANQFSSFY
ncbi:unnamed protein product [Orchesella dallaii]|uniref:C2H2-type domain-containing protein n=1 Tax=Orchesella dallaii TaxID=48710 RepID=A0ABP1PYI4_9HEXA